jgi:hypothetical protein
MGVKMKKLVLLLVMFSLFAIEVCGECVPSHFSDSIAAGGKIRFEHQEREFEGTDYRIKIYAGDPFAGYKDITILLGTNAGNFPYGSCTLSGPNAGDFILSYPGNGPKISRSNLIGDFAIYLDCTGTSGLASSTKWYILAMSAVVDSSPEIQEARNTTTDWFKFWDGFIGNNFCNGTDVWDTYRTWALNGSTWCYDDAIQLKEDCAYDCQAGSCVLPLCLPETELDNAGGIDYFHHTRRFVGDNYFIDFTGSAGWSTIAITLGAAVNPFPYNTSCTLLGPDANKFQLTELNGFNNVRIQEKDYIEDIPWNITLSCPGSDTDSENLDYWLQVNGLNAGSPMEGGTVLSTSWYVFADKFIGNEYCNGSEVWDDYRTWFIFNGTDCYKDTAQFKENCTYGCSSGICVFPVCFNNSDCGIDSWLGSTYCNPDNVWDLFITYACQEPATINATCTNTTNNQLKENCAFGCDSGACLKPDLKVKYFIKQGPASPTSSQDVVFAFIIRNKGDVDADNVTWKLDFDDSNTLEGTIPTINSKDDSSIFMKKHTYAGSGTYNPELAVDIPDSINESDETNNQEGIALDIS